jgi:hypothetical protein
LKIPFIDTEIKVSPKHAFDKNFRNVLITPSSYALSYLRSGFLDITDLDFLIFEDCKMKFGQKNPVENIIKEFYIP